MRTRAGRPTGGAPGGPPRNGIDGPASAPDADPSEGSLDVEVAGSDGRVIRIRTAVPTDEWALRRLHQNVSDTSRYLRFFGISRGAAAEYVTRLLTPSADREALVAWLGDQLVGVASYERIDPDAAEVALLVADDCHHLGIGTLLLEHLAGRARTSGITHFTAEVLGANGPALRTLHDLGGAVTTTWQGGTALIDVDIRPNPHAIDAVDGRERAAEQQNLGHVLAPASVAVVGAGTDSRSVGHQVLRNILTGGYTGAVHAVNPHHESVLGVPCVPSCGCLPEAVDLAVLAVPAAAVPGVVRECGQRKVRAVLVLTAGFGETGADGAGRQDAVLQIARRFGMRLVGPNCLGLLNTDPAVRLNASFADIPVRPGSLGLVSQSGALGIGVLDAADREGLGVAQFVSIGNRADLSSNDLLLAWEGQERVRVIALYLESLGNPRKFARIARRVSRTKPIIAIKAGRSTAGQRAGRSHTAAAVTSDVVIEALFRQAGVLRVDTMQEMLDAARVLCDQPVPTGSRLAVIGNAGGPEILAADTAASTCLDVVELEPTTQAALCRAVPSAASCRNPVDLGATVTPAELTVALDVLVAADEVDSVLIVLTRTAVTDIGGVMDRIMAAADRSTKPLVACRVGEVADSLPLSGPGDRALPVFAFPEPAVSALALATRYGRTRSVERGPTERPAGMQPSIATTLVATVLSGTPASTTGSTGVAAAGENWLTAVDAHRVLTAYGLPVCRQRVVADADEAVAAARSLGYPVAVKFAEGGLHKTELGGVRLGVADDEAVRRAVEDLIARRPGRLLVQPMIEPGTELIVGAVQHDQFGATAMVGAGGVLADLLANRSFRLAPLSRTDATDMLAEPHLAPVLDGFRGAPPVSRERLADLLIRVAALADDVPEIAELDLNPVICRGERLLVADARIRVARASARPDQLVRRLPL